MPSPHRTNRVPVYVPPGGDSPFPSHFVPRDPYGNVQLPPTRNSLDADEFEPYVSPQKHHDDPYGPLERLHSYLHVMGQEDSAGGDLERPWIEPTYADIPRSPLWRPKSGRTYPQRSTRYAGSYL